MYQQLTDSSFPSGHVLMYTAFFGFLMFLGYTLLKPSIARAVMLVILGSLVALVGLSRIYLGDHWASDVTGAYLLGSLWLAMSIALYRWGKTRFFVRQPLAPEKPGPTAAVPGPWRRKDHNMITSTANSAKHSGKAVLSKAKRAATNPWLERLERFGFVMRGLIYFIIGVLALQLAIGAGGATATPTSAIALIGRQPMGQLLLLIVAVGLAGYSLWGFVRAIFDPLGRGSDAKGLLARAGFLFSGVSYGLLLIPTVLTLLNKSSPSTASSTAGVPAALLSGPYGKWIVVAFGTLWIAAGAAQVGPAMPPNLRVTSIPV